MAFLTDDDFKAKIKDNILATLLDGDPNIRLTCENDAIAQAYGRLNVRFDVDAIFSASGANRNSELVMYLVDMTLYHLHSRITPGQVPELRAQRYADALEWLKNIASGDWEPNLPKKGDADGDGVDDKEVIQWGGRPPANPYY